jgi:hypothetical protein
LRLGVSPLLREDLWNHKVLPKKQAPPNLCP